MAGVDVWLVRLEGVEPKKALCEASHAALHGILRQYTGASLDFAAGEHGKPYLPAVPELHFNLSHSHQMALVAVSREVEVGVDVEWFRPLPACLSIAERFFPPAELAALMDVPPADREREFFRLWTRIEAKLKARGIGLLGAGQELDGEWSVEAIDVGPDYAASVAARCAGLEVTLRGLGRA
jgi:4'-phosphopantetheinyl transferase